MMTIIGAFAMPVLVALIIFGGLAKGVPVFDSFLEGAGEGVGTLLKILPSLVGMITAVEMFKASGALDVLTNALSPLARWMGLPGETMPLVLLHPISGGGATAVFKSILSDFGPDSYIGRVASVMCGASETTFYAVTVYYGSCGVKKIRHTLLAALIADFTAAVMSGVAVRLIFGQS